MENLITQKMEIAKRAGELHKELLSLSNLAEQIEDNKTKGWDSKSGASLPEALFVRIQGEGLQTNGVELNSWNIDPNGAELHDALLLFLNSQIDKRKAELNELIKVLQ